MRTSFVIVLLLVGVVGLQAARERLDPLVNFLQCLIEAVLVFHPAVWWVSRQIRIEREHCCDDLAVKACGDSVTYARALAQLEALRMPAAPAYALALTGNKGSLLSRVKRLVSGADLRPSFGEGFMAALVVVGGFMLLSFGAWAGMKQEPQPEEVYTLVSKEESVPPAALDLPAPEGPTSATVWPSGTSSVLTTPLKPSASPLSSWRSARAPT